MAIRRQRVRLALRAHSRRAAQREGVRRHLNNYFLESLIPTTNPREKTMEHVLPPLPYALDALAPESLLKVKSDFEVDFGRFLRTAKNVSCIVEVTSFTPWDLTPCSTAYRESTPCD